MNNVTASPLQNALAGGMLGNANGMSSQHALLAMRQADMLRQYNSVAAGTPFHYSTRLQLQVECVSNGFLMAVGSERLIAKDIEELQQHFTAQVANMLLEKSN